jgi:hypothetical protein
MRIPALSAGLLLVAPALAQDGAPPARPGFISHEEGDPALTRGIKVNAEGATDGYLLLAPLNSTRTYLVDMDGTVKHTWEHDSSPGGGNYLLADGTLLRCGREDDDPRFKGGGIGGRMQKVAPDGTLLWSWRFADESQHQHHDLEPLPNGNVLLIAWERMSQKEALLAGRDKRQVGKAGLWPDMLLEVRPILPDAAEVVWEWHAWDHIVQDADERLARFGYPADHPGRIDVNADHRDAPPLSAEQRAALEARDAGMAALGYAGGAADDEPDEEELAKRDASGDWLHTNCVSYHPLHDLILLSSPELNEIFIIDHSTTIEEAAGDTGGRFGHGGELLWRWGNPRNYGAGTDADRQLWYQHHPTFIDGPSGELRVLVFNNGSGRPGKSYSSVEELVLPFDAKTGFARAEGAAFGPAAPVWTYANPDGFYSAFISGAERLASGNTLVCCGAAGRVFEVTPAGQVVWDFYSPLGGDVTPPEHAGKAPPLALFRSTRLARDHAGVRKVLGE